MAKFSLVQQRSHFALWAVVKAPLLLGADLELISRDSLRILTAREVGQGTTLVGVWNGVGGEVRADVSRVGRLHCPQLWHRKSVCSVLK